LHLTKLLLELKKARDEETSQSNTHDATRNRETIAGRRIVLF